MTIIMIVFLSGKKSFNVFMSFKQFSLRALGIAFQYLHFCKFVFQFNVWKVQTWKQHSMELPNIYCSNEWEWEKKASQEWLSNKLKNIYCLVLAACGWRLNVHFRLICLIDSHEIFINTIQIGSMNCKKMLHFRNLSFFFLSATDGATDLMLCNAHWKLYNHKLNFKILND